MTHWLVVAISILVALAAGASVAGALYALMNDPDRKWAK